MERTIDIVARRIKTSHITALGCGCVPNKIDHP
jgi:hypothetical protein